MQLNRMRPKLPLAVENIFPVEIVRLIYSYVPHFTKNNKEHSSSLCRELKRIQNISLRGKNSCYMRDFEIFCLD